MTIPILTYCFFPEKRSVFLAYLPEKRRFPSKPEKIVFPFLFQAVSRLYSEVGTCSSNLWNESVETDVDQSRL
ncbi:hypothetical protein CH363_10565 [Leptospira haakeii]|uniref:Uncharacterized protein n=1 Tax=Leptospira haakeii TaxID=2023198 RepID=A0ABX4PM50_9LEPT|nr:hypothetical protein CH363_10565 [Leptospira haakeii]PKA19465.1 hypothetical protein CH377_12740 [Leptospira haakeii]